MNLKSLKTMGILAVVLLIIIAIVTLFFKVLPYILLAIVVIWIATNIMRLFSKSNKKTNDNKQDNNLRANIEEINENNYGEVIDVDYHEVDE